MICSRLLKSCATPPVRWPMASIFWDWRTMPSALHPRGDVHHPDDEAAGGDRRLVDVQFASAQADVGGIGGAFVRARAASKIGVRRRRCPSVSKSAKPGLLQPDQVFGQVQQAGEAAVEGAEQPVGGEIGDAFAHRFQGRLQDRGFVGARAVRPRPG